MLTNFEVIVQFVEKKTDVLVNLPTGFGKSLTYQSLSSVFDALYGEGHIVVGVGANIKKSWNFCYTIVLLHYHLRKIHVAL